jgi:hypothetical protein
MCDTIEGLKLTYYALLLQSLSEVVGTHVVSACKWIITVFYTQYRSAPPPPTPINVASTKTHQT